MLNYLQRWIDQLRWQRLEPFQRLARMLLDHLDGILNYCRTKVPLGVVEAINGNLKALLRRGRGYKNLRYLLLKAQRMAALRTEFGVQESGLKMQVPSNSCAEPVFLLTLCGFLLTNSVKRPRAVTIGLLHALSMLVHQISVFFFPAALIAIWTHSYWSDTRDKGRSILTYALTASLPVIAAYLWVWLGPFDRGWSLQEFMSWITSNGTDVFAFHSPPSNALESLRSSLRVFFGGRVSLALEFVERPLLIVLVCLMLAALSYFAMSLGKSFGASRRVRELRFVDPVEHYPLRFLVTWVAAFAVFLFIWLTEYPYYRLYYLPAVILLLGFALKRPHMPIVRPRLTALTAFVSFMSIFNFTFLIYPYSKIEASPPMKLAMGAKEIWNENVLVLYKEFTCDNWMMRYFNPQTNWRQINFTDRDDLERQTGAALQKGRTVWLDTTVLGHLTSSVESSQSLQKYGRLSSPWGISNRKHHIQFAQLLSIRDDDEMRGESTRNRVVVSAFEAWDPAARNWISLTPGTIVRNYHIGFNAKLGLEGALHPYTAEFDIGSGRHACPLDTFEARTKLVSDAPALAERSN